MKVIFLDRDGVINNGGETAFVNQPSDFQFIDGSLEAIRLLTEAGWRIFIVTNQGGIAAGFLTESTLIEIHKQMLVEINVSGGCIEAIYYCRHSSDENCLCRKPKPGMLLQAKDAHGLDFTNAYMIGDWITDIQAAERADVTPIAVLTGRGQTQEMREFLMTLPVMTFGNLYQASVWLERNVERSPNPA